MIYITLYLSMTCDLDPFNTATGLVFELFSNSAGPGISMVNPFGGSSLGFVVTVRLSQGADKIETEPSSTNSYFHLHSCMKIVKKGFH